MNVVMDGVGRIAEIVIQYVFYDGSHPNHLDVKTSRGVLRGAQFSDGVTEFRGVKYGKAERFKAPVLVSKYENEFLDCTRHGKRSVQRNSFFFLAFIPKLLKYIIEVFWYYTSMDPRNGVDIIKNHRLLAFNTSEDCLNLIVQTPFFAKNCPEENKKELLPVMVFIHGGAFLEGFSGDPPYVPRNHRLPKENVVVVNVTYRLGLLGFLKVEGGDANCGLLDIICALKWVKEEINFLGGDPNNVTIFGESAGAFSVSSLLAISQAQPYFQKAIIQSGGGQIAMTKHESDQLSTSIAAILGIDHCSIESMQNFPVSNLLAAQVTLTDIPIKTNPDFPDHCGAMPFLPSIDGVLLTDSPYNMLKNRSVCAGFDKKEIIIGVNENEGSLFSFLESRLQPKEFTLHCVSNRIANLFFRMKIRNCTNFEDCLDLAKNLVNILRQEIRKPELNEHDKAWEIWESFVTNAWFRSPSLLYASVLTLNGHNVYHYEFNARSPLLNNQAAHGLDVFYVFGSYDLKFVEELTGFVPGREDLCHELSETMRKAWASFAKSKNYEALNFNQPKQKSNNTLTLKLNSFSIDIDGDDKEEEEKIGLVSEPQNDDSFQTPHFQWRKSNLCAIPNNTCTCLLSNTKNKDLKMKKLFSFLDTWSSSTTKNTNPMNEKLKDIDLFKYRIPDSKSKLENNCLCEEESRFVFENYNQNSTSIHFDLKQNEFAMEKNLEIPESTYFLMNIVRRADRYCAVFRY